MITKVIKRRYVMKVTVIKGPYFENSKKNAQKHLTKLTKEKLSKQYEKEA
jgi:hypothetical protein